MHDRQASGKGPARKPDLTAGGVAHGAPAVRPVNVRALAALDVLALQRAVGNRAVVELLRRAGRLRGADEAVPQRSRADDVHAVLRSPGRPLAPETRRAMEARLCADFGDVRMHDDESARDSARALGARAYTSGSHIVIGEGGEDPQSLAHELVHVVQQRHGPVAGRADGFGLMLSDPGDRFERQAETVARRALAGPVPAPGPGRAQHDAPASSGGRASSIQRAVGFEIEVPPLSVTTADGEGIIYDGKGLEILRSAPEDGFEIVSEGGLAAEGTIMELVSKPLPVLPGEEDVFPCKADRVFGAVKKILDRVKPFHSAAAKISKAKKEFEEAERKLHELRRAQGKNSEARIKRAEEEVREAEGKLRRAKNGGVEEARSDASLEGSGESSEEAIVETTFGELFPEEEGGISYHDHRQFTAEEKQNFKIVPDGSEKWHMNPQFTVDVPMIGLNQGFNKILRRIRPSANNSKKHFKESIAFGREIAHLFQGGQTASGVEASGLEGYASLLYTQLAALVDVRLYEGQEIPLVKECTAVMSRVSMRTILTSLPEEVQTFLKANEGKVLGLFEEHYRKIHHFAGSLESGGVWLDFWRYAEAAVRGHKNVSQTELFGGMTELSKVRTVEGVTVVPIEVRDFGQGSPARFDVVREVFNDLAKWSLDLWRRARDESALRPPPLQGPEPSPPSPETLREDLEEPEDVDDSSTPQVPAIDPQRVKTGGRRQPANPPPKPQSGRPAVRREASRDEQKPSSLDAKKKDREESTEPESPTPRGGRAPRPPKATGAPSSIASSKSMRGTRKPKSRKDRAKDKKLKKSK